MTEDFKKPSECLCAMIRDVKIPLRLLKEELENKGFFVFVNVQVVCILCVFVSVCPVTALVRLRC